MEYQNARGDYHKSKQPEARIGIPKGASKFWPNYMCRNSCGFNVKPDSAINRCPKCGVPLIRYVLSNYSVKSSRHTTIPSESP